MNLSFNLKKTTILLLISIFISSAVIFTIGCSKDDEVNDNDTTTEATLSQAEIDMLTQMREEEKLARDVYNALYTKHGKNYFTNISSSEQTHMDKVLDLLNKYGINDPAPTEAGKFTNPDLQNLYNMLVAKGDSSLTHALLVGATIEDLDIYDLEDFISKTDNTDILSAFDLLNCGSRNHMRSFISNLNQEGGSYTPVFITQAYYDNILNTEKEKCN